MCAKFGSDRFRNVDLYKVQTNIQTSLYIRLYYIILYYIVLYYIMLYYIILYYIILYYIILYYIILCYFILCYFCFIILLYYIVIFMLYCYVLWSGPHSSVCIATGYGLDGPGIESRWGTRFSTPVQTGPRADPSSCTMGTGSSPGVKSGRGVTLTPHPFLVLCSCMSRAIPLLCL